MPMSVNFRWKAPNIQVAQPQDVGGITRRLGDDIVTAQRLHSQRVAEDRAEEERLRRNAEHDRIQQLNRQGAAMIRDKSAARSALIAKRDELKNKIAAVKAELGIK